MHLFPFMCYVYASEQITGRKLFYRLLTSKYPKRKKELYVFTKMHSQKFELLIGFFLDHTVIMDTTPCLDLKEEQSRILKQ